MTHSLKKYAFFPGCSIPSGFPEYEKLVLNVLKDFDIEVEYLEDMTCCPAPMSFDILNDLAYFTIGARNIALAEEKGLDILSPCPGCTMTLERTNSKLKSDSEIRQQVDDALGEVGRHFEGSIEVKSLMRILYEDIGIDKIKSRVKKPLAGLKVAIHYGCHAFDELERIDDPRNPTVLEDLCKALGAEIVEYPSATECCLVFANPVDRDYVLDATSRKFNDIVEAGADCIVVICASCFSQLDKTQEILTWIDLLDEDSTVPVLLYPELLAFTMDYNWEEIGFDLHKVDPSNLLLAEELVQE